MALVQNPQLHTNGKLELINGTGTVYECITDDGDFKAGGLGRRFNARVPVSRRGRHMGSGYGERRYPQLTFTEKILQQTAASAPGSIRDFITGTGPYAAEVGVNGAGFPYTINVRHTAEVSNYGGVDDVNVWNDVDFNAYDFAEGEPNTNSLTGDVQGTHTLNGVVVGREISQGGA